MTERVSEGVFVPLTLRQQEVLWEAVGKAGFPRTPAGLSQWVATCSMMSNLVSPIIARARSLGPILLQRITKS